MRVLLFLLCISSITALQPGYAAANRPPVIMVVGDSISAAYGMPPQSGWVSLLSERLQRHSFPHRVVNASISGDTTANGVYRLPSALEQHKPAMVIIELGGNDGLRGLSLERMRNNLAQMIEMTQASSAQVVLAGIRIPPNYGKRYTEAFYRVYEQLARQYQVPLVPFLLDSVGGKDGLMQSDGLHPTETAQPIILDNVWQVIRPHLRH